ncbi:hypothetical protein F5Y10DRAFT_260109 [Nemania abortiva]|nr:hypothetical protein F5Y10DRAFT_260109 [Nemania abortiva]
MDANESSTTPTETTSTIAFTPTTSEASSAATYSSQPPPPPSAVMSGPIPVTTLSVSSWRTEYPRIGQFAMTASEEVVAAGPSGLIYFRRLRDHESTPWSEPRPLPDIPAILNDSSVSGLAVHFYERSEKQRLDVYCVSGGVLYNFYRIDGTGSPFAVHPRPPFSTYRVSGTPAATTHPYDWRVPQRWSLVVPCQSGGLLHTSIAYSSTTGLTSPGYRYSSEKDWEKVDHVATELGVISAASITTNCTQGDEYGNKCIRIIAACVAGARLHVLEGQFAMESGYSSMFTWRAQASTRVNHPGEVTGNPVLITEEGKGQLDLLAPSTEGGIFHFVRTASAPDEWHMIARITFFQGLPMTSCLAVTRTPTKYGQAIYFRALVQSGGQLYQVKTYESANPWSGSYLKPIVTPGPFAD